MLGVLNASLRVVLPTTVFALVLPTFGCGDDDVSPPIMFDAGPRRDAGADAGMDDGGPEEDAGERPDSGPIEPGDCSTTPADRVVLVDDVRIRDRRVALAAGSEGILAAWVHSTGGFDELFSRLIPRDGEPEPRVQLTTSFAQDRAPALLWTGSGYLVGWHDNDGRGFEVVTRALNARGEPTADARTLTTVREGHVHDSVAFARTESGIVATFVEEQIAAAARRLQAVAISSAGVPMGTVRAVADPPVSAPSAAGRGEGSVVVWVRSGATESSVRSRALAADLTTVGGVGDVSVAMAAAGTVDVAQTPGGQLGAVYDVDVGGGGSRLEVRFRALDGSTGAGTGLEQLVTAGTDTGRDPGLAAFSGGFAVGYRGLSGAGLEGPRIRLALVDARGALVETLDLDETTPTGGPVRVAVGFDGTVVVAWAELGEMGTRVVARRIRCRE